MKKNLEFDGMKVFWGQCNQTFVINFFFYVFGFQCIYLLFEQLFSSSLVKQLLCIVQHFTRPSNFKLFVFNVAVWPRRRPTCLTLLRVILCSANASIYCFAISVAFSKTTPWFLMVYAVEEGNNKVCWRNICAFRLEKTIVVSRCLMS